MQFEKIRTINKRKIIVGGLISLSVISALVYFPSRAKYRNTQSFPIANGTISYKVPDFGIVAMYTIDEENNEESINTIPTDDSNYTYTLNTDKSACTVDGEKISSTIELENGLLNFKGLSQKGTKCSIYFDKVKVPEGITSGDIIAGNPEEAPSNKFASVATTDEGVFKVADPMYGGNSYYWRGAVTNNYVKFAGFCWRIIRINGDGSIRMIYDGTSCHANGTSTEESIVRTSTAYCGYISKSPYVGYTYEEGKQRPTLSIDSETGLTTGGTRSYLKTFTESWYNTNITNKGYGDNVADGKFCNDRNTASGSTWGEHKSGGFYYAAYGRLKTNKTPTLACPSGDVYTLKAGAITADEVSFAGGVWNTANSKYYLYNGQDFWTMSPSEYDYPSGSANMEQARVFYVKTNGGFYSVVVNDNTPGIRPVINLHAKTTFKADTDGTLNNPYVVQ